MDHKKFISCSRTAYTVDHNVISNAENKEDEVIDAYQDEAEWAERKQVAVKPDFITQKI